MTEVAVIGAGTMGNGIAHHFSLFGFKVFLVDISEDQLKKAAHTIEKNLDRQLKKELISAALKEKALSAITFTTEMEAAKTSELIVEAAPEDIGIKAEILKNISRMAAKTAVIASNTSSISITALASHISEPSRFIGMHFMNPVPVMKLVEIINGYATAKSTTEQISDLIKKINKVPVVVNDYPGFISNRILMPMINEAIYALHEGVAGVKEIDTIMKLGMGHPMGPLQLADYIGLDVCLSILKIMYQDLGNPKYAPCPLLKNMVTAGKTGMKSGEGFYQHDTSVPELAVSKRFLK